METSTPRIEAVQAGPAGRQLAVTWTNVTWATGKRVVLVDLDGWIASGGAILSGLKRHDVFARAALGEHGASVTWDEGDGDLSIDAVHLEQIAREQQPFGPEDVAIWQATIGISNGEAAGLLGLSPSTWANYKAGTSPIPHAIRLLCRSILRDPLTLHAWLQPARSAGRLSRPGVQRG